MSFCRKCGTQMDDSEIICPNCGHKVEEAVTRSGGAVAGDLVGNCISYLKSFFSKDPLSGAGTAFGSKGYEGAAFLGLFALVFSFFIPAYFSEIIGGSMRSAVGSVGSAYVSEALKNLLPFGPLFGLSILVALICVAVILGAVIVHIRVVLKKNTDILSIVNLVGYATIPVICAMLIGMLFGLFAPIITSFILSAAVFMQVFIIVATIRELSENGKSDLFICTLFYIVAYGLIALFMYLIYKGYLSSSLSRLLNSLL